jgi:lysozyme
LREVSLFEGTVLSVYIDVAGHPTIGTGHCLTPSEISSGAYKNGITKEQAQELLARDIADTEAVVNRFVTVPLSQEQFDVLVSFTFNEGSEALKTSRLLLRLNQGDYDAVPGELLRWFKRRDPKTGKLVEDQGLLARRRAEGAIWNSGHDHPATKIAVAAAEIDEAAKRAYALNFDLRTVVEEDIA